MSTLDILKLVAIFLFLTVSALSWLAKQLAEQKKIKNAKEAAQRREEQMLRTGRTEDTVSTTPVLQGPVELSSAAGGGAAPPVPSAHNDAKRRLQELAERRKAQLDELRRRQASAAQGGPTPPVVAESSASPDQARRTPAGTQEQRRRPASQQPQRKQSSQTQSQPKSRPSKPARPAADKASPRAAAPADSGRGFDSVLHQREAEAAGIAAEDARFLIDPHGSPAAKKTRPRERGGSLGGIGIDGAAQRLTPADWRRAIMMREILGRPVSERGNETERGILS